MGLNKQLRLNYTDETLYKKAGNCGTLVSTLTTRDIWNRLTTACSNCNDEEIYDGCYSSH